PAMQHHDPARDFDRAQPVPYILGHAEHEIKRLELQGAIIEGVTRRLIRDSGIGNGMRMLEIGCVAGDVSLLLAEAVGPQGSVVAVDREGRAIETARARTRASGHENITFMLASDEELPDISPFDAAVGRYVLVHQRDPAAMVRRAAKAVRPG